MSSGWYLHCQYSKDFKQCQFSKYFISATQIYN